jgi:hypothetical protein
MRQCSPDMLLWPGIAVVLGNECIIYSLRLLYTNKIVVGASVLVSGVMI